MLTSVHFFPFFGLLICISHTSLLPEYSFPHSFTTVFPKNLLSITNLWTLVLIHLGLSCLGFTDLVFFFPQELKDISYLINCFINTVIGSICLNNSMSLLHLVPYSLYFARDIAVLSQVSIHLGNCSFSFSCVPVSWVLITFLFQNQNTKVLKKLLLSFCCWFPFK